MAATSGTTLFKLKSDEEILDYLRENGWVEKGNGFFEKPFKRFRIVLERENDSGMGWKFSIVGNYQVNNNKAISDEIESLKSIFSGFWFQDNAYNRVVGQKVNEDLAEKNVDVPVVFKDDRGSIQKLVALLLSSGADFIFNDDYMIAYYIDNNSRNTLKLKVIKIEDQVDLQFDRHGNLYLPDGEKFL